MTVVVESDAGTCLKRARQALRSLLHSSGPLLLLASGGSCLELLASEVLERLPIGSAIAPLDERFSLKTEESNSLSIAKRVPSDTVMDLAARPGESLQEFTERIQCEIGGWISAHPGCSVIATMGIGEDGHTAGILPESEAATTMGRDFIGYVAGDCYPGRVTVTFDFLRNYISHTLCYVVGHNKRSALAMLTEPLSLNQAPNRILLEMPDVQLFTDQDLVADGAIIMD